jgi:hypothetical protein
MPESLKRHAADMEAAAPPCPACRKRLVLEAMTSAPVGLPFAHFVCACGASVTLRWSPWPTRGVSPLAFRNDG